MDKNLRCPVGSKRLFGVLKKEPAPAASQTAAPEKVSWRGRAAGSGCLVWIIVIGLLSVLSEILTTPRTRLQDGPTQADSFAFEPESLPEQSSLDGSVILAHMKRGIAATHTKYDEGWILFPSWRSTTLEIPLQTGYFLPQISLALLPADMNWTVKIVEGATGWGGVTGTLGVNKRLHVVNAEGDKTPFNRLSSSYGARGTVAWQRPELWIIRSETDFAGGAPYTLAIDLAYPDSSINEFISKNPEGRKMGRAAIEEKMWLRVYQTRIVLEKVFSQEDLGRDVVIPVPVSKQVSGADIAWDLAIHIFPLIDQGRRTPVANLEASMDRPPSLAVDMAWSQSHEVVIKITKEPDDPQPSIAWTLVGSTFELSYPTSFDSLEFTGQPWDGSGVIAIYVPSKLGPCTCRAVFRIR